MYIIIYICTEHLDWDCREDPPVLGVCLGMWNFLDMISYMPDSCSLSLPSGLRIKMLGLPAYLAIRGLYLIKKSQKSYTCTHVSEILTGLFSRSLMS